MPIYEYRCPKGHTFELQQRMADPPAETCEVCGKGPVVKVLHPVPVFFKGSGFYSTDYGRKKKQSTEGGGEPAKKDESKPAEKSSEKTTESSSSS